MTTTLDGDAQVFPGDPDQPVPAELAEQYEAQPAVLQGVVSPPTPGAVQRTEPGELSQYGSAVEQAKQSLAAVRERLAYLRLHRGEVNAEIRQLVIEEELLDRMSKIRPRPSSSS